MERVVNASRVRGESRAFEERVRSQVFHHNSFQLLETTVLLKQTQEAQGPSLMPKRMERLYQIPKVVHANKFVHYQIPKVK